MFKIRSELGSIYITLQNLAVVVGLNLDLLFGVQQTLQNTPKQYLVVGLKLEYLLGSLVLLN
jgi:hypothetical protein